MLVKRLVRPHTVLLKRLLAAGGLLLSGGCRNVEKTQIAAAPLPAPPASTSVPAEFIPPALPTPPSDLLAVKPNELGRIPVVMYHDIGARGPYTKNGLNISPDTFRRQLNLMYEAGWVPVNLRDIVDPHLNVPAGKTPVVLTFDDGRGTQFKYLPDGSLDPNCALGILEAFHRSHPDWALKGTFYIIGREPAFWQDRVERKKLEYLLQSGFEVANHSETHRYMNQNKGGWVTAAGVQKEIASCIRAVKALVPNATMDTFALPGGGYPKDKSLWRYLKEGSEGGTTYRNRCVVMAWGGPTLPPAHRKFDTMGILRIGVEPGYLEGWIKQLKNGTMKPYISDGDPNTVTVPQSLAKEVDSAKLSGARLVVYDDGTKANGKGKANAATPAKPKSKRPLSVD